MPTTVLLEELTREDVRALAPRAVVILPTAAIEQHGPHLPICVDRVIGEAVAERAARRAAPAATILVAPAVAYGISAHHFPFPGVLSLAPEQFIGVLRDLADSFVRSGFRRIFILNAHGGNDEAVRLAARQIALDQHVLCGAASYWTLAWDALVGEGRAFDLGRLPGHAGAFETSLMLALRPELLEDATLPPAVATLVPSVPAGSRPLIARPETSDGQTGGYSDDPARATPDAGERFLEIVSREVARTLVEFAAIEIAPGVRR
jgi:creatinine amidohydrolase